MPTPINYTNRDFESIIDDIKARIPDYLPDWVDTGSTDFGIVLLELFSIMADSLHYYIDRGANEAFLDTAVRRASVLSIANMFGYRPVSRQAATVTLTFTRSPGYDQDVTIPAGTVVITASEEGESPVRFETDSELVLLYDVATPQDSGTVTATEGTTHSEEVLGISTGLPDQVFPLFNTGVIFDSWEVEVGDGPPDINNDPTFSIWTWVNRTSSSETTQAAYTTYVDENDVSYVIFGDGVSGKIPPSGTVVRATYRTGVGSDGNVGVGAIKDLATAVTGVGSVTNLAAASGGTDAETIEAMRVSIPRSLRSLDRAVTLRDYSDLSLQVTGVAKAVAAAQSQASVIVYIAPSGGGSPLTALKDEVLEYLQERSLVNTTVTMADPTYVSVNVTATVNVLASYVQSTVLANVEEALADLLDFDTVTFGQRVTLGSVYRAMMDVDGVDYVTLSVVSRTTSGVSDVVMATNEIPTIGAVTLTGEGGLT